MTNQADLQGERITIEYILLDKAVLWDENPKQHDLGSLCESIMRYGFVDPPKFDAQLGAFVYGNGRTIALRMMREQGNEPPRGVLHDDDGQWYIPVKFGIDQASRDVAQALAVDHNNLTMLGGEFAVWDVAKMWDESYPDLLRLLAEAEALPVSVDGDDLDALLKEFDADDGSEAPEAQVDRAAELQEKWGVKLGDVWEAGEHFVICGDCREIELSRFNINLVLTDPPYGISIVKAEVGTADSGGSKPVTIGTIRPRQPYPFGGVKNRATVGGAGMVDATLYRPVYGDNEPFDPTWLLDIGKAQIVFGGNYFASKLPDSRCWIVWDKNNTGNFADAELAWTSFDKGVRLYQFTWNGLVRSGPRDIEGVRRMHPTQKPAGLFADILRDFSNEGDAVLDPYLGSGTTLLACHLTRRIGIGVEIDPAYCAVTLERLADMGLTPHLVTDNAAA